jgi:hypothetical protein
VFGGEQGEGDNNFQISHGAIVWQTAGLFENVHCVSCAGLFKKFFVVPPDHRYFQESFWVFSKICRLNG